MKRHICFIACLMLALFAVGCTQDILDDGPAGRDQENAGLQQVILIATLDDVGQTGTKTALIDKKFHWSPNDSISLFYGPGEDGGSLFISTNTDYVKKTTFSGYIQVVTGTSEGSDATKFWGIFPYDPTASCVDGGAAVMTTVKSSQETGYNSWGKSQNISIGRSLGLTMGFSNLCGGFIFCVTQPGIERVVLRRNDGTPIAGQVKVTMDSDEKPVITQMLGTETEISVTAPEGFTPISGSDTTWFYVVVPPTENEEQYTFTLYNGSGQYAEYEVPYTYKVKRNTFKRMRPPIDEGKSFTTDEFVEFEDPNFKAYCVENFDRNGDGEISTNEASKVPAINVCTDNIQTLEGIDGFPNLKNLTATGSSVVTKSGRGSGQLTSLDVSANTKLETLDCRGNQITELDVSNNPILTELDCTDNPIETLQVMAGQTGSMTTFEIPEEIDIEYNGALTAAFPDENFRAYVFGNFDTDGDGFLSRAECDAVISISVYTENISSLEGIEVFTELESLSCRPNYVRVRISNNGYALYNASGKEVIGLLTSLDLSANKKLQTVRCDGNQLTSLDVSNSSDLTSLICHSNQLTSLDVGNNHELTDLPCYFNNLTSLDVSHNVALTDLVCYNNQLTSLDVSHNVALTDLSCYNNKLIGLDLSNNTELTKLSCSSNQLVVLDVSHNVVLTNLFCGSNKLTSLIVSNNVALTHLSCPSNQLTSLDVSNCTALSYLDCDSNKLTSLDVSNNTALGELLCESNQLTVLDVSHNVALTHLSCRNNKLTNLNVSKNTMLERLTCDLNQLTSLDVSSNVLLKDLFCSNNQLTSLDVSYNTAMERLYCSSNQLSILDISGCTVLGSLNCDSNQLTNLDVSNNLSLEKLVCEDNPMTTLYLKTGQTIGTLIKPDTTTIEYK